jgi:hypothetical protein
MSIPQALLRDEIPRNEAYIEVRRSASGPEGRGMRVTQPFGLAQGRELVERQMGVFRQPLKEAAGVQDVIGIKDPFYTAHDLDGPLAEFHIHKPIFCDADTMLS